jgi:UTP-glucose-1-phosphate uridylyltransferase
MKDYERIIHNIGDRIRYRVQHERLGFGHAVYQCQDFAAEDPVLLLLGDTIYSSGTDKNCTQQLIEAYEALEKPLVAIHKIPFEQVIYYGIISGVWKDDVHSQMEITRFVEKPIPSIAEKKLAMLGQSGNNEYYAVFGQYILPPEIFVELQKIIEAEPNPATEIDMTGALSTYIGKNLTGVVLDGTMYDIGNPPSYRNTIITF